MSLTNVKLAYGSDLHYDFVQKELYIENEILVDGFLFAGDYTNHDSYKKIKNFLNLKETLKDYIFFYDKNNKELPLFQINGNHEYYFKFEFPTANVKTFKINGVRIIGCTLWTDFFNNNPFEIIDALNALNDFRGSIKNQEFIKWSPYNQLQLHLEEKEKLQELIKSFKPHVIMTHHAPSRKSIPSIYEFIQHACNGCYVNDMDDIVRESGAQYWIHGHTHNKMDYMIGNTRVLCNPSDYFVGEFEFKIINVKV